MNRTARRGLGLVVIGIIAWLLGVMTADGAPGLHIVAAFAAVLFGAFGLTMLAVGLLRD